MLQTIKTSKYDLADRRTQVIQPDAGKSTFKFDALGNLLERQTANLEAKSKKITYEYEFNRLTNIHYPENPQNDVRYVFGSKNESQNRKGRLILMEDATGAQEFSYGVLGEIESIRRTIIVPNSAVATYVTSWKYDSWNRLQEMIYPDQEKISYTYNSGGLLQAVAGKKAYSYNYVNKIGYDKFEQRSYLKYCNGTETKYTYEPLRRRLDNMTVASGTGYQGTNIPRMFMNNKYQYDKVSNVLNVTNSAAGVTNKMGGIMVHNYSYDNLYQLTSGNGVYTGADQKTANYNLEMKYDDLHNIVSKTQNVMQNKVTETGALKAGYTMNYNYNSTNKHQLDNVTETEYRTKNTDPKVDKNKNNKYVYDKNGNMIYVNTEEVKINGQIAEKAQEKKFIWDEENRLGAVDINGYVSNYTYDAGGERVTKLSGGGQGIFVNSVFSGGKTSTSDFTLYVNPYLVAQNGGRYTKHIYIGSQRIVSKLGDFDSYGADPRRVEKAGESFSGVKVNYDAKYKKSLEVVKANYDTFEVPYYGLDNNDYVNGIGFCCNPSGESASASSSSTTGKLMAGKNDNAELQQFYYHPDHLGSSSYISNLDGEVVQHVEYVPFGEVFLEEKNSKWNTPYLFTSKELDRETGMYYFGARYQDPKLGIFISVDPMAEKYPGVSSYAYTLNNPVKFIDPDGKEITFAETVREDGTKLITMTVTGKMINQSGKAYTSQQMKSYAERLSNSIKESYGICGDGFEVNVITNITAVSADNPIVATDHVFRIVDDGKIPSARNKGTFRDKGTLGYASYGELAIYINADVVNENKPDTTGDYKVTGKTKKGNPTLERTGAHELGHSGGRLDHPEIGTMSGNLMHQTGEWEAGTKITKGQIFEMKSAYEKREVNNGRQSYE